MSLNRVEGEMKDPGDIFAGEPGFDHIADLDLAGREFKTGP